MLQKNFKVLLEFDDINFLYFKVTGDGNKQQILSSLRAYPDRATYMGAALRGLFHISKNWTEKPPEVLQVINIGEHSVGKYYNR